MHWIAIFFLLLFLPFAGAKELEKVSLKLQWIDQFQFAGYYMAIEKGFYAKAGLEVELQKFDPKTLAVDEVVAGRSDFGIGRSSLVIDRMKGQNIVALAAIFQSSPFVLLSDKSKNIRTPKDLEGKRMMMTPDFYDTITVRAMLNSQGVDADSIKMIEHSYNPMDIINGKTDVMACYSSNEPFVLKEKGYETLSIDPADYGFDFYSDILFTTQEQIQNHPKRVAAMYAASLEGWKYAFDHIEETAKIIHTKYNSQNKSLQSLIFEGKVLKELAYRGGKPLGMIEKQKFEKIVDIYRVMGEVYPKGRFEGFIYDKQSDRKVNLTMSEILFLQTHSIKAVSTSQWPPFNFKLPGKDEPLSGIAVDFWRKIVELNGIEGTVTVAGEWSEVVRGLNEKRYDVTLGTSYDKRRNNVIYSKPYAQFANVIATSKDIGYVSGLSMFNGKKIAIGKDYAIAAKIGEKYPKIDIIPVKNTFDGLDLLEQGKVDGVVDILPVVSYLINRGEFYNVQIGGTTEFDSDVSFMIRSDYPELKSIIDKTIDTLTEVQKQEILDRYVSVIYKQPYDYTLFKQVGIGVLIVFLLFGWRHFELERYNQKLLRLSVTDPLTHLFNRLKLDEKLSDVHDMYRRNRRPYSVIMIDVDWFKSVNDLFGHLTGDKVLVGIAKVLQENARKTDSVGRWGGEEFMIVCPETQLDGAHKLAEKLREMIEHHHFPEIGKITCSFGVSEVELHDTAEKVVKRADDALYQAKELGRNRVCILRESTDDLPDLLT